MRDLEDYVRAGRTLSGWEPRSLPGRLGPEPGWDYEACARGLLGGAHRVLDLGTGGGEVLSRILPPGARALATEEWGRNAPVAAQRLADLGVGVVRAPSTALPLRAASFDLVLARHEAIRPAEVARVLAPGGRFLTQQCTHDDWCELRRFFPAMAHFADHAVEYRREFRAAGLELEAWREHRGTVRFRELGPLVYWPAASPWLLPHFDLDADAESIRALEGEIDREGGVTLREGRYLLQVRRPPA